MGRPNLREKDGLWSIVIDGRSTVDYGLMWENI